MGPDKITASDNIKNEKHRERTKDLGMSVRPLHVGKKWFQPKP